MADDYDDFEVAVVGVGSTNYSTEACISNVLLSDGTKLNDDEGLFLRNLKFPDGTKVLDTHRHLLYEFLGILDQLNSNLKGRDRSTILETFKSDVAKILRSLTFKPEDLYFESTIFEPARNEYRADISRLRDAIKAEKGERCRKCGSENTFSQQSQTRGGDEITTTKTYCQACNHHWISR